MSNITFDMKRNSMEVHDATAEPWRVTLIDTGEKTIIGGRIKRILPYLGEDSEFCLTYGDGVGDVDVRAVIDLHHKEGRLATVTATQPLWSDQLQGNRVTGFQKKAMGDGGWINGGFFVLSPNVGNYIDGDATVWEQEPMRKFAAEDQLSVYFHRGS
jgi:glucose-1-phosphate cytidylyltransferase